MQLVVSPKFLAINNEPWRLCVSKANTNVLTEEIHLLGYNAMLFKLCLLPAAFALVSCSAYSSSLKLEAVCSSETSVNCIALFPRRQNSS
jgi:hypothetical protein